MWHVDDQSIVTKECHFTKELSNRLGQACEASGCVLSE